MESLIRNALRRASRRAAAASTLCCIGLLALFACGTPRPVAAGDLILAEEGASEYQIVLPDAPSVDPSWGEDAQYWRVRLDAALMETAEVTQAAFAAQGAELPIVAEGERDPAKRGIYLGATRFARNAGVDTEGLKGWSYVHKAVGQDVVLAGRDTPNPGVAHMSQGDARQRLGLHVGTLKAVADFLREHAGARFLYPGGPTGVEFMPLPAVKVPAGLDRRVEPVVRYNAPGGFYRRHGVVNLSDALYLVANNFFPITETDYRTHRYIHAVPTARYMETHPEYFALVGGRRIEKHYCVSNAEVRELIYQNVVESVDLGYEQTTLSQQDGFRPCQCEACRDLYDTGDDWGEKLWVFHRRIAERLLEDRPGKRIMLSSYGPTLQPPKSFREFPENIAVELSFYVEPERLFDTWRAVEVPGGFHAFLYLFGRRSAMGYNPQNTPYRVGKMVKDYHGFNVHSIYMDGFGQGMGIAGPTYYVLGRMWDDPEGNTLDALLAEYYEAAFLEAEEPMRGFFGTLFGALEPYQFNAGSLTGPDGRPREKVGRGGPMGAMRKVYPRSILNKLGAQLSRAEDAARSEKVLRRLALVRIEFDHLHHIAKVAHLEGDYEQTPNYETRERLLEAVDEWNAFVDSLWSREGVGAMKREPIPGWPEHRPFRGYSRGLIAEWRTNQGTPLVWDTAEVRRSPLPGASELRVAEAEDAAAPDVPVWSETEAAALKPLAADGEQNAAVPTVQAAFDGERFYARLSVPEGAGEVAEWDLAIDPFGDRARYYRFTVKVDGARREAAFGFIAEDVHPLYGKEDPTWNGAWDVHVEDGAAVFAIPFDTLGVEAPEADGLWRGNVGVKTQEAHWLWSVGPGTRDAADRNHFGEFRFGAAPPEARADEPHPVTALRERVYRETFKLPGEWDGLPGLLPGLLGGWVFRSDPEHVGLERGWHRPDADTEAWRPMPVPAFWAETQVGSYLGHGWYRATFRLPEQARGKPLRLLFGGVDERAWVYVNGHLVDEPQLGRLWSTPFAVDVDAQLLEEQPDNLLAVRVHASRGNAGIWRPVLAQAMGEDD